LLLLRLRRVTFESGERTGRESKQINSHSFHYLTTRDLGSNLLNKREFRTKGIWKEDKGKFILNVINTNDLKDVYPVKGNNIEAAVHTVWIYEPLDSVAQVKQPLVTFQSQIDIKGSVPTSTSSSTLTR